jgi:phosphohistidine phosphatase
LKVYLARHAKPVDASVDPHRPLSSEGFIEIEKVADHLSERGDVRPEVIIHSGKERARQTAEVLASRLDPPGGVREQRGLSPNDTIDGWDSYLLSTPGAMLVGHMPFMGLLSCELTRGTVCGWNTEFRTAEVSCYESVDSGGWNLLWHIAPEDI